MPPIYDVEFNSAAHYPTDTIPELAARAEAAGFGAFWAGESNANDPVVVLSGIAARTSTILLGTAAYHVFGRSPITLAIQAATLQDLSRGRLLLGLGVSNRTIAAWHGATFDRPLRRMSEYVTVVRQAASGERVEYQGQVYTTGKGFKLAWKPNHPSPPIYVAAMGPQMARLAGQIAEGVLLNMATPAKIGEVAERVRAGALEAGRDPSHLEVVAKVRVAVHPDASAARHRLRQLITFYNLAEFYSDMLMAQGFQEEVLAVKAAHGQGGFRAAMAQVDDAYMDRLPVVLAKSVEEAKDRLQPYLQAGVTRLIIPYVPTGDAVLEDARRFLRAWESAA
ncbi:MAG: LLM class flavin-dependent oxidoreductase [Chloroflexi bacterium]|nr:LLM class flavin-dependent oxidoreductase [Chloroflexota bacterium]